MATKNRALIWFTVVLLTISLALAYVALRSEPTPQTSGTNAVNPSSESVAVATDDNGHFETAAPVTQDSSPADDAAGGSQQKITAKQAVRISDRADLQSLVRFFSDLDIDFQSLTDDEILDLILEYQASARNGDGQMDAIRWMTLASGYCRSFDFNSSFNSVTGTTQTLARGVPPDEEQFTQAFVEGYLNEQNELIKIRQQQCVDRGITIPDFDEVQEVLNSSGSVLGFLIDNDEALFDKVQLLNGEDRDELMQLPESLRAELADEMLSSFVSGDSCANRSAVLSVIPNASGPLAFRTYAKIMAMDCPEPIAGNRSSAELMEDAASFGDRTIINTYLSNYRESGGENYNIERAAWRHFTHTLARDFCYGNQTLNALASYYGRPQDQIAGLSAFETSQAMARSVELQRLHGKKARKYLGCAKPQNN